MWPADLSSPARDQNLCPREWKPGGSNHWTTREFPRLRDLKFLHLRSIHYMLPNRLKKWERCVLICLVPPLAGDQSSLNQQDWATCPVTSLCGLLISHLWSWERAEEGCNFCKSYLGREFLTDQMTTNRLNHSLIQPKRVWTIKLI